MVKPLPYTLIEMPFDLYFCSSKKQFAKLMKSLKVPSKFRPQFVSSGSNATTHFLDSENGKTIVIVCLSDDGGHTKSQIFALLVHEAVHVFQEVRKQIGEENPSDEFEAYGIQTISQNLMDAYTSQKRGK